MMPWATKPPCSCQGSKMPRKTSSSNKGTNAMVTTRSKSHSTMLDGCSATLAMGCSSTHCLGVSCNTT